MGIETDGPRPTGVTAAAAGRRVRALLDASCASRESDPGQARELALAARVQARACGDAASEAEAMYQLANIAHGTGNVADAYALAAEARDLAASTSALAVEAGAGHLLAVVHYQAGNFPEALDHCLRALEVHRAASARTDTVDGEARDTHDTHDVLDLDEGNLLNTVAAVYQSMGDHERAIATYETALGVAEPLGRPGFASVVYGNLARIRAQRGEYEQAAELGGRAVDLALTHRLDLVGSLLADLAEAYAHLDEPVRAADCLVEARRVWEVLASDDAEPAPPTRLGVMLSEARVALRCGALDDAVAVLTTALALAEGAGHRDFEVEIHDLLAAAHTQRGRLDAALEHRSRHHALSREMVDRSHELRVRTMRAAHDAELARQRAEIFRLRGSDHPRDLAPMTSVGGAPALDVIADDPAAVQLDAFERLAILAEFRDLDTGQHTKRVGDMAAEIAHASGQAPEWCERLRLAGRLHDIGKVAVPDAVLLKTGPLTVEEFELMKSHTTVGHQILAGSSSPLFQLAAELALTHHEWWDGSGYPHGRADTEIPLSGRIVALADVFDALCSERAYKRAWPMHEAARFVVSGRGVQFDPHLIDSFVAVLVARHPELEPELT
jgi:putative two-component system response regulator